MGDPSREVTGHDERDLTRLAILGAFVEATHDALFSSDESERIVVWNRSAERIFGYRVEEIVGDPALRLFPDAVQRDVKLLFDAVLDGDRVDHVEIEAARKDGMPVPIALSLFPVRDAHGAGRGFVGVAHDLTEQRLAQAALAETEARLREAEALGHVGRWLWDVASGALQWSEEMHRIHGIDPVDFEGTLEAHLATVHPDDVDGVRAALGTSVEAGRPLDVEYRILRTDGSERWLYVRAEAAFGSGGSVVGLRGFAQDVTDGRGLPRADLTQR